MTTDLSFPALLGAATGVGSLPGTDAREAARTSVGALEQLPFLPELPGDLSVDPEPEHRRLAAHGHY